MQTFWSVYFFFLGALFASFYNVVGIRGADRISIMRRSMCPRCNNKLRFIDVIPLLGFIINLGHCHFCKEKIHIKYFLIEVFGGLLFMFSYLMQGFSWQFINNLLLVSLSMITLVSFYEHKIILHIVVYVFIPLLIVSSIITGYFLSSMQSLGICVIVMALLVFNDKELKKNVLYVLAIGIGLGFNATLLFWVISILMIALTKIIKKPNAFLYIVTFSCIISLFSEPYVHDLILKIMG